MANITKHTNVDESCPDSLTVTSPGVKLLPVCKECTVEMITDKIFRLDFPRTNFRYIVTIDNNIHQQPGAAVHSDNVKEK